MKLQFKFTLGSLLFLNALLAHALPGAIALPANTSVSTSNSVSNESQYSNQQTSANTAAMTKYLLNLGGFLGYDLTKLPTANKNTVSQTLLPSTTAIIVSKYLYPYVYNTFLGALPVNAFSTALAQFLPTEVPQASTINPYANYVFNSQPYNNAGGQQGKVSVNKAIDQQTFQPDPVSQAVLNILGTPDVSYCMNYDGTAWVGCSQQTGSGTAPLMPGSAVTSNVIGQIPSTYQYFTYQYNQQFLSQLNSNSLTSPLLYATQSDNNNSTSSPSTGSQNPGLAAQNQAQQAANFIRYVSGAVTPLQLPNLKAYDTLYSQANPSNPGSTPSLQQIQAQTTLDNYFTSLRTYAAQYSVGVSNLYYIMSKRLPQNQGTTSQVSSSQALTEFNMATWRLYSPDMSSNNQWVSQLNNASPATVQKEIATLLAEINYQMYLDRQIQERLLLTNSIMLLQNTRNTQPSPNFTGTSASTNSSE